MWWSHFCIGEAVICGLQINWYEIQADLKQDVIFKAT